MTTSVVSGISKRCMRKFSCFVRRIPSPRYQKFPVISPAFPSHVASRLPAKHSNHGSMNGMA
jgi:hypothetical protein